MEECNKTKRLIEARARVRSQDYLAVTRATGGLWPCRERARPADYPTVTGNPASGVDVTL